MRRRVSSQEPFHGQAGASAAVRAGERVFVSGLGAPAGGAAGSAAGGAAGAGAGEALAGLVGRLEELLQGLGASLADVVRTRLFYTRPEDFAPLGAAHGAAFGAIRPALSLTQAHFLPGGARVLLEAEAVRGAAGSRTNGAPEHPQEWGASGAVRVGDEVWVAGLTALRGDSGAGGDRGVAAPGDVEAQSEGITGRVLAALEGAGARAADIVATRHYTAVAYAGGAQSGAAAARRPLMHPHHPTSAGITVQGVGPRTAGVLVEVEAVIGAGESRQNRNTGRPYEEEHHYSRSVRVGEVVYVSGTTSVQLSEEVGAPFDAYGQTIGTLEWIRWGVERQGLSLADLVRTRSYVVGEENLEPVARGLREVLGAVGPVATVVGVPALGRPSILVEIEATAVAGTCAGIVAADGGATSGATSGGESG